MRQHLVMSGNEFKTAGHLFTHCRKFFHRFSQNRCQKTLSREKFPWSHCNEIHWSQIQTLWCGFIPIGDSYTIQSIFIHMGLSNGSTWVPNDSIDSHGIFKGSHLLAPNRNCPNSMLRPTENEWDHNHPIKFHYKVTSGISSVAAVSCSYVNSAVCFYRYLQTPC